MASIYIFDTVSNTSTTIKANGKLRNILPEIDFKHSLVLKAGNRLDSEYECTPDDVLYVRKVPASTTVIAVIAITAAVVAVGVGVGSAIYAKRAQEQARAEMEKAQRNAQNMAAAIQQLPFIRGAKNRKALGENVQFVMGSVYNTPYNLTDGFYSIDGSDGINSYYNAVFSAGYGNQKITELKLGNERIAHNNSGISGIQNFDADSLYYDLNNTNCVEVRQSGEAIQMAGCNQKVSATYAMAELKHDYEQDAVPVVVQAAENAMSIQVCIQFSCLRSYDSEDEEWKERTARVVPYWSNDGGQTWNSFVFAGSDNNSFTRNTNRNIRFVATKNFTAAESFGKNISIKVVKETPMAKSGSQEECCLLWYQTWQYDADQSSASSLVACAPAKPELFNKTTRIAYRIIANEVTQNIVDELHAMSEGYARTWNGTAWSSEKSTTRNPASWLLEVLTSPIHAPSQFDTTEIKLASFGALYEYCELNGFHCDGILTQSEKKLDIVEKILSLCNSSLIINQEGLLEVCIDKEEQNPVALLNAENIVSFSFSKSLQKKTDGTKVTYTNREAWTVDTFYSMLDGGSYDYTSDVVSTLALDYVTEYQHAYKMAQRKHRQIQLQPREIKVDVGSEGDWYPLYSTVLLQIPQLLQGLNSSVIKSVSYNQDNQITAITISDLVDFVEGSRYGVIIQATNQYGYKLYSAEVEYTPADENDTATSGSTRVLTFTTPLDLGLNIIIPERGNHLSFGLLDENGHFTRVTNTMKIYGTEPNGSDGYTLTLRDYNEEVYSYGGTIPAYKSNITRPQAGNSAVNLNEILKLRHDMNVLQEDLINAYKFLEMPVVVDADVKSVIIETDTEGNVVTAQQIETQVTCRQGDENLRFVIGNIDVPAGWSYSVDDGKVKFIIGAGAVVRSGQFKIPVVYQPYVTYDQYVDENGDPYEDEDENLYVTLQTAAQPYTQDIWFSYFGLNEGVYLGSINDVSNIPALSAINDFFVWSGALTDTTLTLEGKLYPGRLYKYIGPGRTWKWEQDTDATHNYIAMGDILAIANADLQQNNSYVYEYLDHLTANSIFSDMIIANTAIVETIEADTAFIQSIATNSAFVNALTSNSAFISDLSANTALINSIKASQGFFDNITVAGTSTFNGTVNANGGTFTGQETINGALQLNGIMKSRFPILKVEFAECYHVDNQYFIDQMESWIDDMNSIGLYLGLAVPNVYFKASGRLWVSGSQGNLYEGDVLFVRLVMENGQIANDKFIIFFWDEIHNKMFQAFRRMTDTKYTLYSVTPNSLGTYDLNVTTTTIGQVNLSGVINIL